MRSYRRVLPVLAAVLLVASVFAGVYLVRGAQGPAGPTAVSTRSTGPSGAAAPATHAALPLVPGAPAPVTSGRGTFWLNYPVPMPNSATGTCTYLGSCMNNTYNPSITVTSGGVVAVAYTAFANVNPCAAAAALTVTVVGVEVSTNGGATWNGPTYLDNSNCSEPYEFTSAMWPALTSLANGTLVLAYLEYNITTVVSGFNCFQWDYFPALAPCYVPYDRLVVTESYNNGTTWTPETIINASLNSGLNMTNPPTSWMPVQPAIAAFGDTIYLAWTNWSYPVFDYDYPSIGLNMVVSTDNGTTWSNATPLPIEVNQYEGVNVSVAYGPSLAVNATGNLYIAYATNYTDTNYLCSAYACGYSYPNDAMDIVVAQTDNNGTSYNLSTAAYAVPVSWGADSWTYGASMLEPTPTIAVAPGTNDLYVAYGGETFGNACDPFGCYTENVEDNWLSASTDNGTNWTTADLGVSVLNLASNALFDTQLMTPSVGVGANGTVYVNSVFQNGTQCAPPPQQYYCGFWTDLVFTSTDNGTTFTAGTQPAPGNASYVGYPLSNGFDTSMAIYGGEPWIAWTNQQCGAAGFALGCFWPNGITSQVFVSTPFTGVGTTVSFNGTGLPSGYNWTVNLQGNVREGPSTATLSVSGVPTAQNLTWSVPWVYTTTYGLLYTTNSTPAAPASFSGPTTVNVLFVESALVNILSIPAGMNGAAFSCTPTTFDYCANLETTPGIGFAIEPVGVPFSYGVQGVPGFSFNNCYGCFNVTFLAWSGVGNGSWNSSVSNGSTILWGPVNETVSFNLLSVCDFGICTNLTYAYAFVETGLPSGTAWSVTLGGVTNTSTSPALGFSAGGGPTNFTVWTIPYNSTYEWVGTPSAPSPIIAIQGGAELVNFSLVPLAHERSAVTFSAAGLPAGVSTWGLTVGTTGYTATGSGSALSLADGVTVLNADPAYGSNGTAGYPTGFTVMPETMGGVNTSVALGGAFNFSGPATVVASYASEYWLEVTNSSGGTVSAPGGQWVPAGNAVTLTATASTGYSFVGWSGTGPGAVTATTLSVTLHPDGPTTELATFVLVTPTYQIAVTATGISSSVPVTVQVGGTTYSEIAPFVVSGLLGGSYTISVPTVYPNGTAGTRYVTTGVSSSLPLTSGSLDVTANGTLTVAYAVQYSLSVAPAANGSTNPTAGGYWEAGGSPVPLVATPDVGFGFVGWAGSGLGAVTAATESINVTLLGPVIETPTFVPQVVPPPATFNLTVNETGLPTGTSWSASVGTSGASGTTSSLVLTGLNGSYTLTIATAFGAPGVRYVPATASLPIDVTQDGPVSVVFTTQYLLTVSAGAGGTASASPVSGWLTAGTTVTLSATANASETFVNWSGSGAGAYSGTNSAGTLTLNGPVTETAYFASNSNSVPSSSGGSSGSPYLAIGLLVVLLVVGLVVGLLLGRSRPPSPTGASSPDAGDGAAAEETPGELPPVWSEENAGAASEPGPGPSSGVSEEETIYGGGSQ